jgi:hypothetical protein
MGQKQTFWALAKRVRFGGHSRHLRTRLSLLLQLLKLTALRAMGPLAWPCSAANFSVAVGDLGDSLLLGTIIKKVPTADIVTAAKKYTMLIECRG